MKKKNLAVFMSVLLAAMFSVSFVVTTTNSEGATLITGTTDSVESAVDPAQAYDFFGWEIIQNTGCGLFETETGTGDIMPSLATDWSMSEDGLTWNFTLRQGVKFDDETEFNATHVKYSFDRSMGIASPDGPQVNMGYSDIIDSVEVVSKYVVRFNLKIPFAPMLRLMACPASFIVNPAYAPFDQVVYYTEGDARASSPMDLGPYVLTHWTRVAGKDTEMWLEANPNYWRSGYPKTEKIIIKFYAYTTALRLAVEAGDVDIAFRHLSPTDIEDLQDDPDLKVWQGTGGAIQYMVFQEAIPPLNDSRVRRAITAALDRPTVCSLVFLNQTSPLYSIIPDGMMGHTEAFAALGDANHTLTRSLLAELGYNETNKLAIDLWYESSGHYAMSAEQALIYKSSLEASGVIEVTLKSADWPTYRQNRINGIMEVFIYGWYPDYIDPDNYAFLYYAAWLNHHYIDYGEHYGEMKAAYDAARTTTNESERIALYADIDNYAVMDCPVVPLWQGKAWAATKPNIKGVHLDITQSWRMWYLYSTLEPRIYIRADGSVDPDTAPISSLDNITYTFTGNIFNQSIVVERDNIVVDGAGYTLQGTGGGWGIDLSDRSNVTIKNTEIITFDCGIWLDGSLNNTIYRNNIKANGFAGVLLQDSLYNLISGNNITDTGDYGIRLYSSYNILRNNSIANNRINFWVGGWWNDVDASNTVNGKPIYYWINKQDMTVPPDAGYVALVNCKRITVRDLNLTNKNRQGVLLVYTTNSTITKNSIANNEYGIYLDESSNNTISGNNIETNYDHGIVLEDSSGNFVYENNIKNNEYGIWFYTYSSNNLVCENNITDNNPYGIVFFYSSNNSIYENNIKNNDYAGISLYESSNNKFYHNNFVDNTKLNPDQVLSDSRTNVWDDGYPSGGNYWSDHNGTDMNHDGIGDTPHEINSNNKDNHPLMGMFHSFSISLGYHVKVISNSTIEDFQYFKSKSTIKMYVSNMTLNQTFGFCRVCIPKGSMPPPYEVIINDGLTEILYFNDTIHDNDTHRWLYFAYSHSTHKVEIIPEFSSWPSMLLILTMLTVGVIICMHAVLPKAPSLSLTDLTNHNFHDFHT